MLLPQIVLYKGLFLYCYKCLYYIYIILKPTIIFNYFVNNWHSSGSSILTTHLDTLLACLFISKRQYLSFAIFFNKRQNKDQNMLLNTVPLLNIIPFNVLNKSYHSKNRSISSIIVIIIIIAKYPKNFVYLLIITKIALATSLILVLIGGKFIIKFIINFNIGLYRIKNTNNSLYRRCLDICTL